MSVEFEQLVDKPKSKSKVWKHFGFPADVDGAIKHKKKIVCRLCKAVVAYSGNTTNLSHHLQRSHWQEFSELSERGGDKPGPSTSPTAKQLTLPGAVERSIPFPHDSEKHKRLVNATADFICQGLQPLRVVDEVSFRGLLEIAEPRFQLPHRTHFTDKVIPAILWSAVCVKTYVAGDSVVRDRYLVVRDRKCLRHLVNINDIIVNIDDI